MIERCRRDIIGSCESIASCRLWLPSVCWRQRQPHSPASRRLTPRQARPGAASTPRSFRRPAETWPRRRREAATPLLPDLGDRLRKDGPAEGRQARQGWSRRRRVRGGHSPGGIDPWPRQHDVRHRPGQYGDGRDSPRCGSGVGLRWFRAERNRSSPRWLRCRWYRRVPAAATGVRAGRSGDCQRAARAARPAAIRLSASTTT